MKASIDWETQVENFTGRTIGTVLNAILAALNPEQEEEVLATLRQAALDPARHRDDRRVFAILARFSDEELDQLMTELYGPCPPSLRVVEGGSPSAA